MKLTKKTKIAIITFVALGVTGLAVIKIKKIIDKRRQKNQKEKRKKPLQNDTMKQILKLPDEI